MKNCVLFILFFNFQLLYAQSFVARDNNWKIDLAKSDEFESDEIDQTKWGFELWFECTREVVLKAENVQASGGMLKISVKDEMVNIDHNTKQCKRQKYAKTSGALISKFEIGGDSYIEIRAKLVDYRADLTSAIWLSDEPVEANNPNLEIDILETLKAKKKPKQFSSAYHIWNNNDDFPEENHHLNLDSKKTRLKTKIGEDFHVFGLERRKNYIAMYIDGRLYWRRNMLDHPEFLTQERRLIINVEGHFGTEEPGDYNKELLVDYVRVYNYESE